MKGSMILKGCTCTVKNGSRILIAGGADGKNLQLQTETSAEAAAWAEEIDKHIAFADENDYLLN
jgi:hypothetical protein